MKGPQKMLVNDDALAAEAQMHAWAQHGADSCSSGGKAIALPTLVSPQPSGSSCSQPQCSPAVACVE